MSAISFQTMLERLSAQQREANADLAASIAAAIVSASRGYTPAASAKPKPAVSAPAKPVKAASPFITALAEKREAKIDAGTHRACPNCGKAVSVARTVELCKSCHEAKRFAGAKGLKARAR